MNIVYHRSIVRQAAIYLAMSMLSSCMNFDQSRYPAYRAYIYENIQYTQPNYNPNYNYANDLDYGSDTPARQSEVTVPNSYHVGASHSPVSAKNVDRAWVSGQNPQGYTIDVANDEKPSSVAGKLYQLPKNNRMAEVQYRRNGRNYYKGVYGSYSNKEDAEKALNALPDSVKASAVIKNWGDVQSNISQ